MDGGKKPKRKSWIKPPGCLPGSAAKAEGEKLVTIISNAVSAMTKPSRIDVSGGLLLFLCALLLTLPSSGQLTDQTEAMPTELDVLNNELATKSPFPADPIALSRLLTRRASLLSDLIAADPARALSSALPAEVAAQLQQIAPAAAIESNGEWEGTVEAIAEDDFANRRSRTRWYLSTTSQRHEMYFVDPIRTLPGAHVKVSGVGISGRIAVASLINTAGGSAASTQQQCTTTGPQNIAVLMLTTPDSPSFPPEITATTLQQVFFGSSPSSSGVNSLNLHLQELSYGQTWATGQVFGPLPLTNSYTKDQLFPLFSAALALMDPSIDLTRFTRFALVLSAQPTSWPAGVGTIGCVLRNIPSGASTNVSVSWLNPHTYDDLSAVIVMAHEFGHNLGLGHAKSVDYGNVPLGPLGSTGSVSEYGDLFSLMGSNGSGCNQWRMYGYFAAPHSSLILGWLRSGDYREVLSDGVFTIAPLEAMNGLRALRILRDAARNEWLWVEYRQPVGIDSSFAGWECYGTVNVFNGALIHWERGNWIDTFLLDFNPLSQTPDHFDFLDAAITPGQAYFDSSSGLTLRVNQATTTGLEVSVAYLTSPPVPGAFGLSAPSDNSSGLPTNLTLSWQASLYASSYDVCWGTALPSTCQNTAGTNLAIGPLAEGARYYWTVTAKNGGGSTSSATWSFTTQPSLTVSPRELTFNYSIGGLAPALQSVSIANANAGALSWSASSSAAWLIVTPTSGTAASTISVSVNPSGLAAGTFSGNITVAAPGAASQTVAVTLSIVVSADEVIAQVVDGSGWKTSITLVNLEDQATSFKLYFWGDDGQPLVLPIVSIGLYSSLQGTLPVGGSVTIETDGNSTTNLQGWAELDAGHAAVGGMAVFRQRVVGRPDFEAVVPLASRYESRFVLPFDNLPGFTTSMAIVNPSSSAAGTVTAEFRAESGEHILLDQFVLGPRNHAAFNIRDRYPQVAGRRGTVEFSTPGLELTALGLRFNDTGAFTSFPPRVPGSGDAEVIAQIADGGGWKTSVTLVNLQDKAVAYKLNFWDSSGQPLVLPFAGIGSRSTLEGTLPVAGSATIETAGTSDTLREGWGELAAGQGSIGGMAVFCQRIVGRPDFEAVVPLSSRYESRFVLPFDNTAGFTTSMAIVNASYYATAVVTAAFRTEGGQQIMLDQFTLGPQGHIAFSMRERYPQMSGGRGVIEFSTPGLELSALGLRFNDFGAFTSFPTLSNLAW